MRAAVYVGNSNIEIKNVPIPKIGNDEILLKVKMVGLCKTDVKKIVHDMFEPPRIFGHEITGEIAEVGDDVKGFSKGDRVLVFHHVPCLDCFHCRHDNHAQCETYRKVDTTAGYGKPAGGGFAEYIRIPKLVVDRGLIRIPDDVSFEEAAGVEPLNCCQKAIKKANLKNDDDVLIVGQGSIGLTLTQLCRRARVRKIISTDLHDFKLDIAKKMGADLALNGNDPKLDEKITEFNGGTLPTVCFLAVESTDVINFGLGTVSPGGRLIFVFDKIKTKEFVIDPNIISNKEIDLIGSYSSDYTQHEESARLIFDHEINVKDIITHRFELDDLQKAVQMANNPRESIKIIITVG